MKKYIVAIVALFLCGNEILASQRQSCAALDLNRPIQQSCNRRFHYVAPEELQTFLQAPEHEKTHLYFKDVLHWLHKKHPTIAPDQDNSLLLSLLRIYKKLLMKDLYQESFFYPMRIIGNLIERLLYWIPRDLWYSDQPPQEAAELTNLIDLFESFHFPNIKPSMEEAKK